MRRFNRLWCRICAAWQRCQADRFGNLRCLTCNRLLLRLEAA